MPIIRWAADASGVCVCPCYGLLRSQCRQDFPVKMHKPILKFRFSSDRFSSFTMLRILSVLTVAGLAALCSADPQVALAGAMPAKTTCVAIKVSNGAQNGESLLAFRTLLTLVLLRPIPLTLRPTRSCPTHCKHAAVLHADYCTRHHYNVHRS